MANCCCVLCSQRGGERGGARAGGGRRGHGGAGVLGAVRRLPRLPLGPQQHLLRAPRPARHAARRHDPLLVRLHRRAHPQLHQRVQLHRVHGRRRLARRQARARRPAGEGLPAQLRRLHRCWSGVEGGGDGARVQRRRVRARRRRASGCRMRGAKRIIGVDLNPEKWDIGKRLGITDFINPSDIGEKAVSEVIKEMTGGGADYCFECIGSTPVVAEAFQSSRQGWGKTVVLGVSSGGAPISIPPNDILWGRSVVGSLFGGLKPKTNVPILAQKYLDKELELDEFVTHEMGFDDINAAFELLTQGKCLQCIIWMDGARENGSVGVEIGGACKA